MEDISLTIHRALSGEWVFPDDALSLWRKPDEGLYTVLTVLEQRFDPEEPLDVRANDVYAPDGVFSGLYWGISRVRTLPNVGLNQHSPFIAKEAVEVAKRSASVSVEPSYMLEENVLVPNMPLIALEPSAAILLKDLVKQYQRTIGAERLRQAESL